MFRPAALSSMHENRSQPDSDALKTMSMGSTSPGSTSSDSVKENVHIVPSMP